MIKNRDIKIDILKGVLITGVVLGHAQADTLHNILFLFHMPLFYIISGYLLSNLNKRKLISKIKTLLVPYSVYIIFDVIVIKGEINPHGVLSLIWGGRYVSGVYWYITAYLCALVLFYLIINFVPKKFQKPLILVGGGYSNNRIKSDYCLFI